MNRFRKLVEKDCEELLTRFKHTGSVRFEIFSRLWKEMKFSQIFYGAMGHEKREFSRLILDIAYSFLLPPFSFQIRVGGLYLVYSLYRCQTAIPPELIRLSLKDWDDVKKFEKDSLDAKHLDVVYILQQLRFLKAFQFTAMHTVLTFRRKQNRKRDNSQSYVEFMERPSHPQELINTELLEELSHIHGLYEKLKTSSSLTSRDGVTSLDLIKKDLAPKLQCTVVNFYNWQQRQDRTDEEEDSGEGTSSKQESSERAERLASIKSKAYGQATEASKSRRHRQVEVNFTSNEAGPSDSSDNPKTLKPSLKTRISENMHISGDVWNETTRVSCLTTLDSAPEGKEKPKKKYVKFQLK
ncbi:snRNA-activating protein complex subunit 1b isoform X2 [Cheilinus undulatus]|uniref:snRNA-activating protein complex subunit 1b isoform X2 n=1 Tax=Cheilinus undulatus TaxID=241271 RepID=UPI001BD2C4D8|nr:snRNA-activating protein complex subunit 1b isoform X2 [Cheilinus undulatus]